MHCNVYLKVCDNQDQPEIRYRVGQMSSLKRSMHFMCQYSARTENCWSIFPDPSHPIDKDLSTDFLSPWIVKPPWFLDNIWNSCLPDFFSLLFFLNNMFLMLWESFTFNFRLINSNYLGLIMSSSGPSAHQHIIFDLSCEELMGHGEIFSWETAVACTMGCFSPQNYTSQHPLQRWELRHLVEAPGSLSCFCFCWAQHATVSHHGFNMAVAFLSVTCRQAEPGTGKDAYCHRV